MILLRCTKKFLQRYGVVPEETVEYPDAILGEWYVNIVPTYIGDCLVFVNNPTRMVIALPYMPSSNVESLFREHLISLYHRLELPNDFIRSESPLIKSFKYAKTTDRSIIGTMNDIVYHLQVGSEDFLLGSKEEFQLFEERMCVLPHGPLKYKMPLHELWSIIGPKYGGEDAGNRNAELIIKKILNF